MIYINLFIYYIQLDNNLIIRQISSDVYYKNILNKFVSDKEYKPARGDLRISFKYKLIPLKLSIIGGLHDKHKSYWNTD